MNLLQEVDISDYCVEDDAGREGLFLGAFASQLRPYFVIPVFELCRAVYFGVIERGLKLAEFRKCWESLLIWHYSHLEGGYIIRLLSGDESWREVFEDFFEGTVLREPLPEFDTGDPRDRSRQFPSLTGRMRQCSKRILRAVNAQGPSQRAWSGATIDSLDYEIAKSHGRDLVLDTNNALDLLCCLSVTGMTRSNPSYLERIRRSTLDWFQEIVSSRGCAGKLILPISVIEESSRIAAKGAAYDHAQKVLQDLWINPEQWEHILQPDPLTPEIFAMFVQLLESLSQEGIPRNQWPHFADALVLAHGLKHGCPVASSEWHEKKDWASVEALFPWLRPENF